MIDITDPRIDGYLMQLAPEPPAQVVAQEERAQDTAFPIIGRVTGRLLNLLTRLKQPELVVEMGSGFGYSAYWFASALAGRGKVVLIDHAEENIAAARELFNDTGLIHHGEFRCGDALTIAPQYQDVDILFIDMDKSQYLEALELMLPRLAHHALVIADNSLWHGRVAEEGTPDADTATIKRFNEFMSSRKDFWTSIIPLRDGVLVAYKLD